MLHVLHSTMEQLAAVSGDTNKLPCARNLGRQVLCAQLAAWTVFNDVRLMQGVLKHGYGRWVGG